MFCTGGEASSEPRLWALGTNGPCYKSRFTSGSPVTHGFPVSLPLLSALLRAAVTTGRKRVEFDGCGCVWWERGSAGELGCGEMTCGRSSAPHSMLCCCRSAGSHIPSLNAPTAGLNSSRKGKCPAC